MRMDVLPLFYVLHSTLFSVMLDPVVTVPSGWGDCSVPLPAMLLVGVIDWTLPLAPLFTVGTTASIMMQQLIAIGLPPSVVVIIIKVTWAVRTKILLLKRGIV